MKYLKLVAGAALLAFAIVLSYQAGSVAANAATGQTAGRSGLDVIEVSKGSTTKTVSVICPRTHPYALAGGAGAAKGIAYSNPVENGGPKPIGWFVQSVSGPAFVYAICSK